MPLGLKPSCSCCHTGSSAMWRRSIQGDVVCNSCAIAPGSSGGHGKSVSNTIFQNLSFCRQGKPEALRRSARLRNTKARTQPAANRKLSSRGKGRRHIFKLKNPLKAPEAVATVVTSDSIWYQGIYYQVGDVVSVLDEEGELYFAQIKGFMQDQYCEKSAVITWLLPTTGSPKGKFDPSTYILGPEEELPRRMEFFEFVSHAPSEYFHSRCSPYPTPATNTDKCCTWTHLPLRVGGSSTAQQAKCVL
uniref:GATA zinc finger domain-containing protein 1-like n=1 Tax=Myxine glutinosa TaxID=7769 RepID=UPI00358F1495